MQHATSISDGRELADNEEPRSFVESSDIDVPPTLLKGSFSTIRHMNRIGTRNATSNRPRRQNSPLERRVNPVTAFAPNPVKSHTHVQLVAAGQLVNRLR
jgi:hypothetical protein